MRSEVGQTLIEFLITSAWMGVLIVGVSSLLKAEWDKTQCAYQAFEIAHAALTGSPRSFRPKGLQIHDEFGSIEVETHCGDTVEKIRLLKLESLDHD